jgi:biopolymer transport protein ExbB
MIQAFFVTANLPVGTNKGEVLAEGIYVALVTTFAGLSVAIPASVLAHMFEARILSLLRDIEQTAVALLPQVERYDGQLRADPRHGVANEKNGAATLKPLPKSMAS